MEERRSCTRWQIHKESWVKLDGALEYAACILNDINFKGMQVILKQHLSLDKFLKMHIMISRECCFDVEVWIAWHKRVMDAEVYGFCFTKIKDSDKEKFYHLLRSHFPQELHAQWFKGALEEKGYCMMENGTPEDKRIFSRSQVNYPLRFLDLNSNRESDASTQDISAKGIGMEMGEELLPNTPLEMWIDVPDKGQPFYTRGEVVWSKRINQGRFRAGISLQKADLMGMSRVLRATL